MIDKVIQYFAFIRVCVKLVPQKNV